MLSMLKYITLAMLLGSAKSEDKEVHPEACPDNVIAEQNCSRKIETDAKIDLTYWVDVQNDKPMFHGHFDITGSKKLEKKAKDKYELRICIEISIPGQELEWREQLMFHAKVQKNSEGGIIFDEQVKSYKKDFEIENLSSGTYFCQIDDTDENMLSESEVIIEQQLVAQESGSKDIFIDFKRPCFEESANAMDLEPGQTYSVYMSYFFYKDGKTSSKAVIGDFSSKTGPEYQLMYLQQLPGVGGGEEFEENEYIVKAGASANIVSWGMLAFATGTTYMSFY